MSTNPYSPTAVSLESSAAFAAEGAILATRWERFAGAFIDNICLMIVMMPIMFLLGFGIVASNVETAETLETVPEIVLEMGGVLLAAVIFLALHGYLLATRGQTIGKVLMKTQIVDRTTNAVPHFGPLVLKRYVWIWVIQWIPFFGGLIGFLDAVLIFRESRACLHDDLAGTKVIKLTRPVVPGPQY